MERLSRSWQDLDKIAMVYQDSYQGFLASVPCPRSQGVHNTRILLRNTIYNVFQLFATIFLPNCFQIKKAILDLFQYAPPFFVTFHYVPPREYQRRNPRNSRC